MKAIKAKLPKDRVYNARNLAGDKELMDAWSVATIYKGELVEVITCRSYMGRSKSASVRHASIWIKPKYGQWTTGSGKAGGYGYCKKSAAVGEAISSAGVKLSASISGVGDSAIEEAFKAIVRACGYRGQVAIFGH